MPTPPANTAKKHVISKLKSDFARSLNLENPMIGAAIISRLSTVQAVDVLKIMQRKRSQRVALHLAEIEANNHAVPKIAKTVLDWHFLSLHG